MRIGIIGNGVVGSATARTYLEHCDEVRIWDIDPAKRTHNTHHAVCSCDMVFVCLPENAVDHFFLMPEVSPSTVNYVLKSTVPIGTTRRLAQQYGLPNLVHSPEFLTARCSFTDAQCPTRNIVGDPTWYDDPYISSGPDFGDMLVKLYEQRFPGVPVLRMSSDESETVKLALNSFFAVKVAYFNEINALCLKLGLDWETVRAGILSDGRIAHAHTQVPGPDGLRGFGGKCLPKDLQHLIDAMSANECAYTMCRAAKNRNEMYDRPTEGEA